MAWSNSKIFAAAILGALDRTNTLDFDGDSHKVALYDNDITPDNSVTAANSAYNAGQWTAAGNEVSDGTEWNAAGEPLTGADVTQSTTTVKFDGTDTPSGGSSATLAAVFGCLVYNDTSASPADQGICYNYFGGTNSVTDGTFTVVWAAAGIFTISVA
jgi:hypothetical protein